MHTPKVTFIVPCYKLAHLLKECVDSILAQTYRDFDVLIMDDCSPDDTADVARSFNDPRVKHVRNDPNLGHLRNYNKGIGLAAGEYVWLISADDRLRTSSALARYVQVMEANSRVGYAICPGMGLQAGQETGIATWSVLSERDAILDGRAFLYTLLRSNCVLAPAGLVRKECYDRVSVFPLDLPFAGDWYLWCSFALHYDVAYLAEPMVNYREHSGSMTSTLIADDIRRLSKDDLAVRWRMKDKIERAGDTALARHCGRIIVDDYIAALSSKSWRGAKFRMSLAEFGRSLDEHARDAEEKEDIRKQVLTRVAGHLFWDSELHTDLQLYQLALQHGGRNPKLWLKYSILRMGSLGTLLMRVLSILRAAARRRQARGA